MQVRAKFTVQSKTLTNHGTPETPKVLTSVKLLPVTNGSEENKSFYHWTPSGSIELGMVNQSAADALEIGKEYYVDFTPAAG